MLIHPSPLGALLVGTVHAVAACAALVALAAVPALLCVIGVALSAIVHVGRTLQWWRSAIHELTVRPNGTAAWRDGAGTWHEAREVTGGVLAPWLLAVGLKEDGRRLQPLLLLPDALDGDALRELRVWLRWRPQPHRGAGKSVI